MYTFVLSLHVLLAVTLVVLVLLQQGKGADAGAIMGAGGANTVFGVGGASSLLVRATTFIAVMFMLTSVGLVKLAIEDGGRSGARGDAMSGSVLGGGDVAPAKDAAAPAAEQKTTEQKATEQKTQSAPVDAAAVPK
jgi:preprotein translocase subunit SecG